MSPVVIGQARDNSISSKTLQQMFELRYDVFHEKLGWQVDGTDRQERDDYDLMDPYYMIATDRNKAAGCWRLLPTNGPYMLRNTFTQLLRGEQAPDADAIWELSRFAVTSPSRRYNGQIYLSEMTYDMISQLIEFADNRHIQHYVTVTSVSVERLMTRCDIPMIRFGDGESTLIGGVDSVACWIPVNKQFRQAAAIASRKLKTA